MAEVTTSSSSGISFAGLLTIVFVVLKLTDVIAWSWLWVLSPLWISFLFTIIVALIVVLVAVTFGDNVRKKL